MCQLKLQYEMRQKVHAAGVQEMCTLRNRERKSARIRIKLVKIYIHIHGRLTGSMHVATWASYSYTCLSRCLSSLYPLPTGITTYRSNYWRTRWTGKFLGANEVHCKHIGDTCTWSGARIFDDEQFISIARLRSLSITLAGDCRYWQAQVTRLSWSRSS